MPQTGLQRLVDGVRGALADPARAPRDAELLLRFVAGDERAFELLLLRHGAMVFQVCLRLLRHRQDAEDAFQATFLALARKAASVRRPEALAGSLHRTAHRAALRLRSARRPEHVTLDVEPAAPEPDPAAERDLLAAVEEEIGRLPVKYRLPVLLCYLEGHSTEEAAGRLGCPKGTVFSRLAWARERVCRRLARRGLAPPASVCGLLAVSAEAGL